MSIWTDATVLITGGTGSFGQAFSALLLEESVRAIRILSRDEFKQSTGRQDDRLRYLIGDVRDRARLTRALNGVNIVVHAAAMKQIPACEYNPWEAVQTNVVGTQNVVDASIDCGVARVMLLSTDKAAHPTNLYGATKLCAEKLFLAGKSYAGAQRTLFSVVRYGNVVGSRGSLIPVLLAQRPSGNITLTDPDMTRFWLTLNRAVTFTKACIEDMSGQETWVPRIPSARLLTIARTVAPECQIQWMGTRQGEKLHETLVTIDEVPHTVDLGDRYRIAVDNLGLGITKPYTSDTNTEWVSTEEIAECVSSASSKAE